MVTRRALLGAGVLALAGCGPPDEPEIDPKQVLGEQLRLTNAAAAALGDAGANAQARARRLTAALERAGGSVPDAVGRPSDPLEAVRAELVGHVRAVGLLGEAEYRELFAGLIASAAPDEAALISPPEMTAFPGTP
ncbi:MAG TPA: hypothetical protein VFZ00_24030 [Solirubrobacter sp.]|nr:hypothetical protein [Solirubrobacter sp.]